MNTQTDRRLPANRTGMLLAAATLVADGVWLLLWAMDEQDVLFAAAGILALSGAVGLLSSQRWSRFLVYGLSSTSPWVILPAPR
jgi:hypothetical protein